MIPSPGAKRIRASNLPYPSPAVRYSSPLVTAPALAVALTTEMKVRVESRRVIIVVFLQCDSVANREYRTLARWIKAKPGRRLFIRSQSLVIFAGLQRRLFETCLRISQTCLAHIGSFAAMF